MSRDIVTYNYVQPPSQQKTIDVYSHVLQEQENDGQEGWMCGRGVKTKRSNTNEVQCFCPPSLYGEYCQYFSDRITVIISLHDLPAELLQQQSNTIKVLALLLSNNDVIDHHIFHLPLALSKEVNKKFRFNLIHRRPKVLSNSYTVRFEAYHLTSDSSIKFLAAWKHGIQFPFLPSYRLVQILKFEKERAPMGTKHICKTANPCLHNSICYRIMNKINNMSAYYCLCNTHSFGKNCEYFVASSPSSVCYKDALVRPLSPSSSICLCPIHLYGPTCHLHHTCFNKNPCGANRGKCYPNPDNIIRDYICVCNEKFFGSDCEFDSAVVRFSFIDLSFLQIPSNFILSSLIQLGNLDNETLDLVIHEKRVYQGLPPSITEIYHSDHHLPMLGIMKLYHKHDSFDDHVANLKQPDYFILYIVSSNVSRMNVTSLINVTNYCPYTPTAFQRNVSNVLYLSQSKLCFNFSLSTRISLMHIFLVFISKKVNLDSNFNASVMVFKYHLLCNVSYNLKCFHDDNYFCLCDMYGHAECSRYDSTLDQCYGRCRAGGQCIHGDLDDRRDFICLCPHCYYGSICQHNTELFSFTLETLLTSDLYSPSVVIQRLFSR